MRTLTVLIMLLASNLTPAQDDLTVLKPDPHDVPPSQMLHAYLKAEAQKHFDARRAAVAALKTPEDVRKRQQELKAKFLEALGGLPEKTPLNARTVGVEERDGYRVKRVIYESRPHHHVTAVLYLPHGTPPFPGVLVPCGHSANGKAIEAYQRACILLAKNGFVVLCYDPIGQGERRQLITEDNKPVIASSTTEHSLAGIGALLVGQSLATYRIWDGIRSLDYLVSRPEVDAQRIGCTGNSGGGTLTAYLMALDDRIAAAAPSCYITSLERLFATIGPQDAEQNITGQVAFGMEHADYLTLRAPKPTLLCTATRDFFDIQGSWTTFREAKQIYAKMGFSERVDLIEADAAHGFNKPQREAATRWMRRWLMGKDDAPVEEEFPIATDVQLQCTRTGQVLGDFKGKSVFDLNAERADALAKQRKQAGRAGADLLQEVRRLIALPEVIKIVKPQRVGEVKRNGDTIAKLVFETEAGIRVPALLFEAPNANAMSPLVVYLHGDGKAAEASVGGAIEKLVTAGHRVLALDPRGIGETAAGVLQPDRPSHFGVDFKESFLALHLNRPLLGQRVYDVLTVIESFTNSPSMAGTPIHLIGIGTAGPIALHAAALHPRITQVTIDRSLISWSNVVRTPVSYNQLTNVVPNALTTYDLPDLSATLAPRALTVRNAMDAAGKPVSQAALDEAYADCKAAYRKQSAEGKLTLQAGQ